jgi:3-oxo-5-alpha-steroid 4-dehydrogenase 1
VISKAGENQGRSYNSQLLPNWILLGLFLLHYVNRSFIFPLLIRGGKPTPFVIFLLAFIFCVFNGYLQCRYLATYAVYPSNWITDPRFVIGVLLFFAGMGINIHSDSILRNLRKPGETTYKIPRGGMFELISGANFFGEILEWGGFALASWSVVGLAFFVYTMSNIGPRAYHHHQWYKSKFEDYPKNRKAIIPFIL